MPVIIRYADETRQRQAREAFGEEVPVARKYPSEWPLDSRRRASVALGQDAAVVFPAPTVWHGADLSGLSC